jgi:hypothetical protein
MRFGLLMAPLGLKLGKVKSLADAINNTFG